MAAELGLQLRQNVRKWNYGDSPDCGDSWEERAFAEDTGSPMGTTWPPRSYTCTFCRREFRSAQALGGHMNGHRRNRQRPRRSPDQFYPLQAAAIVPSPEIISGAGSFIPIEPVGSFFTFQFSGPPYAGNTSALDFSVAEKFGSPEATGDPRKDGDGDDSGFEELDLELRL